MQLIPTSTLSPSSKSTRSRVPTAADQGVRVADYYNQVTEGYRDWSPNINMHFGCYQWGLNPFDLESMLENTNQQVLNALALTGHTNHLLDMGCGLGATARYCAKQSSVAKVTGISLAASQIHEARQIGLRAPQGEKLEFLQANFHNTPYEDATFDGIYAIESACHTAETNKYSLLKEAYRLLKPGARVAICDGMIKGLAPLPPLTQYCYDKTCHHWSVGHFPNLDALTTTMKELNFKNVRVHNLTWRMLPSVAFVPGISARYWWKLIRQQDKNPQHWHHLFAPLWGLLLGANLCRFGYYIVTAEK